MHILIIGGGPAAVEAALSAREQNKQADITIVSNENILPYRRPLLLRMLSENITPERFFMHDMEFYQQKRIHVMLDSHLQSIDPEQQLVYINNNQVLAYDQLLLATGSTPRCIQLGSENSERICYFYNYQDMLRIREKISGNASSLRVIIIGGGFLGLETAAQLLLHHCQVTLIEHNALLLPGCLEKTHSDFLRKKLQSLPDLTILTNCQVQKIISLPHGAVCRVAADFTRQLSADFIIGSERNEPVGLKNSTGTENSEKYVQPLQVNDYLQLKNYENIYAAGDCAKHIYVPGGSYSEAKHMGAVAGMNITGSHRKFIPLPREVRGKIGDVAIYVAGNTRDPLLKAIHKFDDQSMQTLYYRNNLLEGCVLINDISMASSLYQTIARNIVY